jgi:branched-chain amino acid transport system permease protein
MSAYYIHLANLALIYVIMTLSFNVSLGYTGLMNLGHVGLMGIGAYTSAVLSRTYDWPVWLSILAASLLAMLISALLAIPSKKIKGDYYALVTLGFMFVSSAVFINWDSVTRGTLGIPGIERPEGIANNVHFFAAMLLLTAMVYVFLDRLMRSPFGRALEAVRDDEEVAASLGKPVFKLKLLALLVSGFLVGLSGALLAHYIQFISPNTFWLDLLVWALAGMMIGGMASIPGSVLGTVLLFAISEPLRFLDISASLVGPLRLVIFMAILVAVVIYRPKGLMGRAQLDQ